MSDALLVAIAAAIPATITAAVGGYGLVLGIQNKRGIADNQQKSQEISDRVDGQLDAKIKEIRDKEHAAGRLEGADAVRAEFAKLAEVAAATKASVDAANELAQRNIEAAKLVADALVAKTAADALIAAGAAALAAQQAGPVPPPDGGPSSRQ